MQGFRLAIHSRIHSAQADDSHIFCRKVDKKKEKAQCWSNMNKSTVRELSRDLLDSIAKRTTQDLTIQGQMACCEPPSRSASPARQPQSDRFVEVLGENQGLQPSMAKPYTGGKLAAKLVAKIKLTDPYGGFRK